MSHPVLESIATGTPELARSQEQAAAFMASVERLPEGLRKRIGTIYEQTAIETRHSCILDYGKGEPEEFSFFPKNWSLEPMPSTAERNQHYREAVLPLVEIVGRDALEGASCSPEEVTHVISVSCTGFFAPGIDIELVKRLGLPRSAQRTMVGFMGCYAALNALRVASAFCRAEPLARVLVVCAELCTLHLQLDDSLETAVVNALFSDGAAAAVVSGEDAAARPGLAYVDNHALLDEDSMDHMTWDIGDSGFLMGLSPEVPDVLAQNLPAYLDVLLGRNELSASEVDFWAIHPGGRAIVECAQEVLELPDRAVSDSLEVLRQYGNMSSPTILFVLKRFLDRLQSGEEDLGHGVALAFGPGLTLEGALFRGMG